MRSRFKQHLFFSIATGFMMGGMFIMMVIFMLDEMYWLSLFCVIPILLNAVYLHSNLRVIFRELDEAILWK